MDKGTQVRLNQESGPEAAYIYKVMDTKENGAFIWPVSTIKTGKKVTSMGIAARYAKWYMKSSLITVT